MPDPVRESLAKMVEEKLKERAEERKAGFDPWPPKWDPKPGDILECLIINTRETRYGLKRIVIDREGNQLTLPSSTAVVREFTKTKAGVGDFVYIKFEGEVKGKNPTPYKDYTIVVIPKDAFDRTGDKFPEPKPIPEPETSSTPVSKKASVAPTQSAGSSSTPPAQEQDVASGDLSKVEEVVKRLADMTGKISGGMAKDQFEKMMRNISGTTLSVDDAVLMFSSLIKVENGKVLKA